MPDPATSTGTQPWPLMVDARTGTPIQPVPLQDLSNHVTDLPGAADRINNTTALGTDYTVDDPNDLTQAGWGILFASDADPALQQQLQPLIDLRKSQVQDDRLFQIFSGTRGVQPGQTADSWAQQRGVSLTALVDPYAGGVPFYILIVGSPDRISFEFQQLLKMQWATGRLYFDDINDYGRYAKAVVAYETKANLPVQSKSAAVWVTRNQGDLATAMLSGAICQDFLSTNNPLGGRANFTASDYSNEKATKANLINILRGNVNSGPPALIFTGSHGCDYSGADAATQSAYQGALLTYEWVPHTPAADNNRFGASDVPADAKLQGTMGFLFACYSGGYPTASAYYTNQAGAPVPIAPKPNISKLPQALLSGGMLAAIAHVDMAFPYALQNVDGTPQVQAVRTPLELMMRGKRVGLAADSLSVTWSSLSSQVSMTPPLAPAAVAPASQGGTAPASNTPAATAPAPSVSPRLAKLIISRDDARNYIVLGDPATRLRVEDLK